MAAFTEEGKAQMIPQGATIEGEWLCIYEMTKSGKRKTTFEKLGTLSDHCGYFYDYNF